MNSNGDLFAMRRRYYKARSTVHSASATTAAILTTDMIIKAGWPGDSQTSEDSKSLSLQLSHYFWDLLKSLFSESSTTAFPCRHVCLPGIGILLCTLKNQHSFLFSVCWITNLQNVWVTGDRCSASYAPWPQQVCNKCLIAVPGLSDNSLSISISTPWAVNRRQINVWQDKVKTL